jgi:hypothetical protein
VEELNLLGARVLLGDQKLKKFFKVKALKPVGGSQKMEGVG